MDDLYDLTTTLIDRASMLYVDRTLTYHNWDHIQYVQHKYRSLFGEPSIEEQLAIAFHDVVYVPGAPSGMNEDLSILVFERHFRECSRYSSAAAQIDVGLVKAIINATKVENHLSSTQVVHDQRIARVLDCDLGKIGAPYPAFLESQYNIIWEYAGELSGVQHVAARSTCATFLKRFLDKPTIYLTKEGQETMEAQARANIKQFAKDNP